MATEKAIRVADLKNDEAMVMRYAYRPGKAEKDEIEKATWEMTKDLEEVPSKDWTPKCLGTYDSKLLVCKATECVYQAKCKK